MRPAHERGPGCECGIERRRLLAGGLSIAAAGLASLFPLEAGAARPEGSIIDVHAHYTAPQYVQELAGTKLLQPPTLNWTIERHLVEMDAAGVTRSILSLTTPGLLPGDVQRARRMARYLNEYAASLAQRYPARIGMFAALPLADTEGSLAELAYGLDTLKADGVGLFTNYEGKWLGDASFDPVFEELDRRRAIAYVHPIAGPCCAGALPYISDAIIEYGTDTTRAITNMIYSGAAKRFPNVRMIFSHAGGTMPYLIERFDSADKTYPFVAKAAPDGYRVAARRFFYDTAQSCNPATLSALRQVIPPTQILFGTDYPFRTMREHVERLRGSAVFSAPELDLIHHGNIDRALAELTQSGFG